MRSEKEIREKIQYYFDDCMDDGSSYAGSYNHHNFEYIKLLKWVLEDENRD